jgi:drug/metabolite transporter (DMT)-like permease
MDPPRHATHVPPTAVLLVVAAVACFTLSDAVVKYLTQRYPVALLVFARYGLQAIATVLWLAPRMGSRLVRSREPRLQIARGVVMICSSFCFMNALRWLPLADATAINYTTPILVVLLSVGFLGERMTPSRWAFVAAGFVGMLLIVRPGATIFRGGAVLALGAAGFYALFQILTRKLRGDDPRVTLFSPAMCGAILTPILLPFVEYRVEMPWFDVGLVAFFGAVATGGHFMFVRAFQHAPASALTPFTYAQLVWAVLLGWAAFGNFPDRYSLAGIAIIAGSGLTLAWHERRRARRRVAPPEPTVVD